LRATRCRAVHRILGLLALLGCVDFTGPASVPNAVPFDPPPRYADLWREVEECSGIRGHFGRIRWWRVPGATGFWRDGQRVGGLWFRDHSIVIGELAGYHVVRHEMLHDLLSRGGHPPYYFEHLCGALLCRDCP
jgi:hypothetical protein